MSGYSWTLPAQSSSSGGTTRPDLEPKDLLLDTNGDITISDGDLIFVYEPVEAGAQEARIRIGTFKGEWFLNLDAGFPWWQDVLGQKYNEGKLLRLVRAALLAVVEIEEVITLEASWDGATRTATVTWEARVGSETITDAMAVEV